MPKLYSRLGDDGYTGILGEERVAKYHPRQIANGTLDEASATLGLARAFTPSPEVAQLIIDVQRDLYCIMSEVAASPDHVEQFRKIVPGRLLWLEQRLEEYGELVDMPEGFVVSGDSRAGAMFDLARAVVRRAERSLASLHHDGELERPLLLAYLNRLSSLCFVLSLHENQLAGVRRPTMAKAEDE